MTIDEELEKFIRKIVTEVIRDELGKIGFAVYDTCRECPKLSVYEECSLQKVVADCKLHRT
jgi:hypothetical protein